MSTASSTQKPLRDSATDLADCIVGLTGSTDTTADRNAVVTALGAGLASFFTQPPCRDFPVLAECHDFALPKVARLFGIHLRAMHPPRARHGLAHSTEFAGHFVDSYVPLIQRALQNGQKVLAFRGWSPDVSETWGVVNRDESGDLWGEVPCCQEPVQLSGPALQCYVVETVASANPNAGDVLLRSATTSVQLGERGAQVYPGLVSEETAFGEIIELIQGDGPSPQLEEFRELFRRIANRRLAASKFLTRYMLELDAKEAAWVPSLVPLCSKGAETSLKMLRLADEQSTLDSPSSIELLKDLVKLNRDVMNACVSMVSSE